VRPDDRGPEGSKQVVKISTSQALALAREHCDAGRWDLAESIARAVAQASPDSAETCFQLGEVFCALQRWEEAEKHFRLASGLNPARADVYHELGLACEMLGRAPDAEANYRRALAIDPDLAVAHYNLGRLLAVARRLPEAEAAYRQALALAPNLAEAANNLGNVLLALRRPEEALDMFRRALHVRPQSADFSNNLGRALQAVGRTEEAETAFRDATVWAPDHALAWSNLAATIETPDRSEEALAAHRRAVELLPPDVPIGGEVRSNLAMALLANGRSDEAEPEFRRAVALRPDNPEIHSALLACLQYLDDVAPVQLAWEHAAWNDRHASALQSAWPKHDRRRRAGRPLRLGFVSADFAEHPVGIFLVKTLEHLDRSECRAVCYHDRIESDGIGQRIRSTADVCVESSPLEHAALAQRIQDDEIDILFDLAGHTTGSRLLTFARKPAPIQITWIGYEGTTGLAAMDYILASRSMIPPGKEMWYRERVLRLPESYVCFDPPSFAPDVTPLPALETGFVTFASFNNPAKLSRGKIRAWAEILRRIGGARLLLKYGTLDSLATQQRYRTLFANEGLDPQRLDFAGWSPRAEALAEYRRVDLALDPFPFSGSATTCDALWMGVPVVTCPGDTFATRHPLSHLVSIGLESFVAGDRAQYVDLAVSWASDLPRLAEVRSGLRERMAASPLCDGPRFARQLLDVLQGVWQEWLGGS
jgi:protein O-GlcNAc transferase